MQYPNVLVPIEYYTLIYLGLEKILIDVGVVQNIVLKQTHELIQIFKPRILAYVDLNIRETNGKPILFVLSRQKFQNSTKQTCYPLTFSKGQSLLIVFQYTLFRFYTETIR